MATKPLLTWKHQSGFGNTTVGFLGKVRVCSINDRVFRDNLGSYGLRFSLPRLQEKDGVCSNKTEDLKTVAETMIAEWMALVGAVPIAWHNDNIGDIISMVSRYTPVMDEKKLRITVLELCQHIADIGRIETVKTELDVKHEGNS